MRLRQRSQVKEMSPDELHRALVEDFVGHIYPETIQGLETQVLAVNKIAEARGQTVEVVFRAILEEAERLGADWDHALN